MAKLSDNSRSWYGDGLRKKFSDWEAKAKPKSKAKKNTKLWCKGKVGARHDVQEVLIVPLNDDCFKNGKVNVVNGVSQWTRNKPGCGHWKHYETKCVNCGMNVRDMDESYKIALSPELQKQKELEEKWCNEGHLYDWVEYTHRFPIWRRGTGKVEVLYEIKTCVMCGKTKGKSRRKVEDE